MSAMLSVQKGVPLPDINRAPKGLRRKYPIEGMEVGDMFFVPGRSSKSVSAYISRISKDVTGRFSARHCWMAKVPEFPAKTAKLVWVSCDATAPGATEGTGVWRIE